MGAGKRGKKSHAKDVRCRLHIHIYTFIEDTLITNGAANPSDKLGERTYAATELSSEIGSTYYHLCYIVACARPLRIQNTKYRK